MHSLLKMMVFLRHGYLSSSSSSSSSFQLNFVFVAIFLLFILSISKP